MTRTDAAPSLGNLPLWAWPTALSLDAPLIAGLWQWLFHHSFGVIITWPQITALALSVWLIYVADRLLDGLQLDAQKPHSFRHALYARHRRNFALLWLAGLCLTTALVVTQLSPVAIRLGLCLGALVAVYGVGVHLLKPFANFSKELQIGLVFALGTGLFVWLESPGLQLALATLLLAGLCSLNCLLIAKWERKLDKAQQQATMLETPALGDKLELLLLGLAALSSALFPVLPVTLCLAVAAASMGLWGLERYAASMSEQARRVAADAALLTPLLAAVI